MTIFLMVLIITVQKSSAMDENDSCSTSINVTQMSQRVLCDQFLISSLQKHIEVAKKLNKYLEHKRDIFMEHKNDACDIPKITENEMNDKCPQRSIYLNCKDAVAKHGSGVYLIDPKYVDIKPLMVYCEADANGGLPWIVIQRRILSNVMSTKFPWHDYVAGVGGLYDNYWMGLENIHQLTANHAFELWIKLTNKKGLVKNALYSHFGLGSRAQNYSLQVLGSYTGDAGDGLRASAGFAFSTNDYRCDDSAGCRDMDGGWWYGKENCGRHLNSDYNKTTWNTWMEKNYGFKMVQMAIREKSLSLRCS